MNYQDQLEYRGILHAALDMGWGFLNWNGQGGWRYPLYQANGKQWYLPDGRAAQRWKNFDSEAQVRFLFGYPDQTKDDVKKPDGCDYYWPAGGAVKDDVIHITAGETDMLTLMSAGILNVVSFFGEQNIPDNLVTVLKKLEYKRVMYYPDNDQTGWDAAQSIYETLKGSGIEYTAVRLPDNLKDLNIMWDMYEFNAELFIRRLQTLKPMVFPDLTSGPSVELHGTGLRDFPDAFYDAIERSLGAEYKNNRGWSKSLACIFASHEHDDSHPTGHWHKDKHIYRCFKCGQTWLAKDVAARLNLDYHDFIPARPVQLTMNAGLILPPPVIPAYKSSDDSMQRYGERLDGKHVDTIVPLVFPFRMLHDLGGFCRIVQPRKLIGIIGLSGGGKTSFLETLTDDWRRVFGVDILWWGPEWSWDQMADRAIQRYGGLSITEMMLHELWLAEEARGQQGERYGERAPEEKVTFSRKMAAEIAGWPGKAFYIDKMDVTLDDLLNESARIIDDQRENHWRTIRVGVWDYAQLLQLKGVRSDAERVNMVVTKIKAFCVDYGLVGIIASQPRKQDSSEAKDEAAPTLLTSEAAQYMREDQFNLMMTLNPINSNGRMTNRAIINVVKNSAGRKEQREVTIDLPHLRWVDRR